MDFKKLFIGLMVAVIIMSCKNYYNDTIAWADHLASNLSSSEVQSRQPDFIEVDWEKPLMIDDQKWYLITKIKGDRDLLRMSHYLVFTQDKYQYRASRK